MSEYPAALSLPADRTNYRRLGRPGYVNIVVHITDGHERARPVAEMWQEPGHGSSAHFVIGQAGEVVQCVSLADEAWHAHAANATSVGIEHCARTRHELGPSDPGLPPSQTQYMASARLVAWLCRRAHLEPTRTTIQGHCEIDKRTSHADCPNAVWDWDRYMALVQAEYDAWEAAS